MKDTPTQPEDELLHRIKWLMFSRVIFATLLIGSTIILLLRDAPSPISPSLGVLYGLIVGIFALSCLYALMLNRVRRRILFAYFQIGIDTGIVSLIIFVTGSSDSIFSFLYLLVIIYASILLFRKGSMIMAALCSIQYGIMLDLEYYGIIVPFGIEGEVVTVMHDVSHVFYKIAVTMIACFAVAILSSFLSEQARKTKKELMAMEDHMKRVEKMAAIGEMAAGLAHEIKNPLAALTGSIQLIQEDNEFKTGHNRLMQIILREADRLSSLVNNFLLFAKPPAGKMEIIELDKGIMETMEFFEKDKCCQDRISITREMIPGIWVKMDPVHLRQVLLNLLLNAAEAIEGPGTIGVRMRRMGDHHVAVDITDTGSGMSREVIQSIFDPFFTTKPSGTGLGLSIVHSILESYDTRLDVESQSHQGTRMTLKFRQIVPSG